MQNWITCAVLKKEDFEGVPNIDCWEAKTHLLAVEKDEFSASELNL
jgi:hypothetical protein